MYDTSCKLYIDFKACFYLVCNTYLSKRPHTEQSAFIYLFVIVLIEVQVCEYMRFKVCCSHKCCHCVSTVTIPQFLPSLALAESVLCEMI